VVDEKSLEDGMSIDLSVQFEDQIDVGLLRTAAEKIKGF